MKELGYAKLYRSLLTHPIFADPYLLKLFNYCLLKASYKQRDVILDNAVITLMPGEFIWGRIAASKELNENTKPKYKISESTWERKLTVLEKMQIVNRKVTNKYTIVKLINWQVYQGEESRIEHQIEHQMNNRCTSDEQQMNTNKKVKKVKQVKKDISANTSALESEFNEWYELYDKKKDRKAAFTKFKTARKKHEFDVIMNGTTEYLKTITDKQFQKYPKTFLHNESFLDDYSDVVTTDNTEMQYYDELLGDG
ncbi:hypothetical protein CW670_07505 [Macrococcoides caseolyticum]|uniref:hypothetical protein n=1 Tax=Macrococcoides caseolyticum TaxID=69966 RepID=UPI000C33B387|nr:hypothetical protein [Macrococcus caseolyticus]PKE35782.1 hypothetical protein CW695_06815 [Macrococcus caseolyticus]PKE74383.1 hypothetical protein CW670_07505 [Macrococcus caseolyticus]